MDETDKQAEKLVYVDIMAGAEDPRSDPLYEGAIGYIPFAYHLLPREAIAKVAAVMRCGERSGRDNYDWAKIPVDEHINHALSHLLAYLSGRKDHTHLANAACRVLMALDLDDTEVLPVPVFDPDPAPIYRYERAEEEIEKLIGEPAEKVDWVEPANCTYGGDDGPTDIGGYKPQKNDGVKDWVEPVFVDKEGDDD